MNASSSTSSNGLQFTHPYLAVVLGGGFTGMLAAAALSEHADVVVVERDRLPRTPALPTDLPQARHAHLLSADGARMVDALLPGSVEHWLAEGARRVPMPPELTGRSPQGWLGRRPRSPYLIACSRDLLDRVIRQQVPALPGMTVLDGTEAEELTGTAEHITGVRVRDTANGATYRLDADLVVDATGRHSLTQNRLTALGLPTAREDVSDSGIVSATRIFRAPDGTENTPVITCRSALTSVVPGPSGPPRSLPGRTATLVPIEGGRWLVTLTGAGDDRPSEHANRFVPFAHRTGNSAIGDLIADAEPLSEVRLSRDTANRRRRYEQLPSWPTGFIALGGAVVSLSPDYGQGLSLAAHSAAALREAVRRHGMDDPALARKMQRTIGRLVEEPWSLATGDDLHSPTRRTAVCRAYVDVVTPSSPAAPFLLPSAALGLLRGTARLRPTASGSPAWDASPSSPLPPRPPSAGEAASTAPRPPAATGASSALSALPAAASATALSAAPPPESPPPHHPGPEPLPRRLPRRLSFGPSALRRISEATRRKPADG
ncbi:pyridine nucleotide-disulfide oxidoreductase [Streptomyces inhibens]|uniref:Pyridine nucleotide-disulfide oxidoreductase n=1 Tax=Streptomyces inhibens TaxID=2293571 RepID=A0A371PTQ4_STRIH|nr:FAD-dependent monooxygenase [Streptomyces inhibens]REK85799.1 pyridine nucleotide-disulfide oxidoreductase [Streptomyces inhibens]